MRPATSTPLGVSLISPNPHSDTASRVRTKWRRLTSVCPYRSANCWRPISWWRYWHRGIVSMRRIRRSSLDQCADGEPAPVFPRSRGIQGTRYTRARPMWRLACSARVCCAPRAGAALYLNLVCLCCHWIYNARLNAINEPVVNI